MNAARKWLVVMSLTLTCLVGVRQAAADDEVPDQCPTMGGDQTVDICVPPSKPRAWITTICVNDGEGAARLRLKNNGKVWTEVFWIRGAGADRLIQLKPGQVKTITAKRLEEGKLLRVSSHGLVYDEAVVIERNCP